MKRRLAPALVSIALLAFGGAGCPNDDGNPTGSGFARVTFQYLAPTVTDPDVAAQFPDCVQGVGQTHIHPGWRGFARRDMTVAGQDRWEAVFDDVPVGTEQRIRISDPNACATDPNGASTDNVFANGRRLTRIVPTPGNGQEPGLAFTVAADGSVTP